MQDVAFGTTTAIASDQILTTLGTLGIVQTLVSVGTVSSRRVQFETAGADASEAAQGVDTTTGFGTNAGFCAFVYVYKEWKLSDQVVSCWDDAPSQSSSICLKPLGQEQE